MSAQEDRILTQAAESPSRGAGDTQKAAQKLARTSAQLRRRVEQFTTDSAKSGNGWSKGNNGRAESVHAHASL
jgi:hypothetical protein